MAQKSAIEWTGSTWNPIAGCTPVSPGCLHCYAATMSHRLDAMGQEKYRGLTVLRNGVRTFNGEISFDEAALSIPLKRKKPETYFVNSMSDLFHEAVPFDFVDKVFAVMAICARHTFQVLTKRPKRMAEYLNEKWQPARAETVFGKTYAPAKEDGEERRDQIEAACEPFLEDFGLVDTANDKMWTAEGSCKAMQWGWPLPNVWLGTSIESPKYLERITSLAECPAAIRFLSLEPLLEDLGQIRGYLEQGIGWVIVGCESGPHKREMRVEWATSLMEQCRAARVPFFMKQMVIDGKVSGEIADFPGPLKIREFPEVVSLSTAKQS